MAGGPGQQLGSSGVGGGEGEGSLHTAESVDDGGDVGQLVGVDP